MSIDVSLIIQDSLREIGVVQLGATVKTADADFCLGRLNQLFDNWNAQQECVWVEEFKTFTFIPNQQDYTIGPSGADFTVLNNRPVDIQGGNVLLNTTTPTVSNPLNVRDYQWWLTLTVRAVTTTFPTDVYYETGWPNGTLHFWPKPSIAYGLELALRNTLAQVVMTNTVTMPPGYQNAIMLTLAEDISTAYGANLSPLTVKKASEARARIYRNNDFTPRLTTQDAGMPSMYRNRSAFNYRTGLNITTNR